MIPEVGGVGGWSQGWGHAQFELGKRRHLPLTMASTGASTPGRIRVTLKAPTSSEGTDSLLASVPSTAASFAASALLSPAAFGSLTPLAPSPSLFVDTALSTVPR